MKRGEIWWVEFDPSVGSEIKKTRPAVIISNDAANRNLARVVVIPLSTSTGKLYPSEAFVMVNGTKAKAMADQIMAADKGRLSKLITSLSKKEMQEIENAICTHLGMPK